MERPFGLVDKTFDFVGTQYGAYTPRQRTSLTLIFVRNNVQLVIAGDVSVFDGLCLFVSIFVIARLTISSICLFVFFPSFYGSLLPELKRFDYIQ